MLNNKAEVIFQTRSTVDRRKVKERRSFFKLQTSSPVDRRRAKDRRSFFKLHTHSPVDRRQCKDRRLFLEQEYLGHKPERRANMVENRRGLLSRYYEYFLQKSTLIFKRMPLAR
jgi:hypothetical protein